MSIILGANFITVLWASYLKLVVLCRLYEAERIGVKLDEGEENENQEELITAPCRSISSESGIVVLVVVAAVPAAVAVAAVVAVAVATAVAVL